MVRNSICMSTVYTSDGPQVGLVIAQPAESAERRSVVGGWGCELKTDVELEDRWDWELY